MKVGAGGVHVGTDVGVLDGVKVGVLVAVFEGVKVCVGVKVRVAVAVAVAVEVGVGVCGASLSQAEGTATPANSAAIARESGDSHPHTRSDPLRVDDRLHFGRGEWKQWRRSGMTAQAVLQNRVDILITQRPTLGSSGWNILPVE